jgi:hypothetical protein
MRKDHDKQEDATENISGNYLFPGFNIFHFLCSNYQILKIKEMLNQVQVLSASYRERSNLQLAGQRTLMVYLY